jgi:HPt (histidine-containing phosphotransfer) domain-containing protein
MGDLEVAITKADAPQFRRAAHTIKGGLRLFGAESAYSLACRLEELGRDEDLEAVGETFENLKQALADLESDLSKFVVEPMALSHP